MPTASSVHSSRPGTTRRGAALIRALVSLHPGAFALAVGGAAVYAVATVASSLALRWVIDHVIRVRFDGGHVATGTMLAGATAIVVVGLIRAAGVIVRRSWAGRTGWRVAGTLRRRIVRQYLGQPMAWHATRSTGELVAHAGVDVDSTVEILHPLPFASLAYRFLEPIAEFTEILDDTQTAVAGWRRVLALLDTPIEIVDPPNGVALPPAPPRIELRGLSFAYRLRERAADIDGDIDADADASPIETVYALRNVNHIIEAARSVAVVGATGSGKTTLARLMTRLADPTEGAVLVAGHDLRTVSMASLRARIVMVPQEPFLFDTTVADNVRFGRPSANLDDVRLAFVELGLESWLDGLADGPKTRVGQRGEHLSAGERQLVALARAYIANPTCLVLDEATSAVDPGTEARLARALESLSRGRTSITIAHRLSTAARADEVLVFADGRLVERGHHDDLVAGRGHYAALWANWIASTAA